MGLEDRLKAVQGLKQQSIAQTELMFKLLNDADDAHLEEDQKIKDAYKTQQGQHTGQKP